MKLFFYNMLRWSKYIIVVALLLNINARAQQGNIRHDSSQVEKINVPDEMIEIYKQNEEFLYDRSPENTNIPWMLYVKELVDNLINKIFNTNDNNFVSIFIYVFIFVLIIYFAYSIFKADKSSLFYSSTNGKIPELYLNEKNIYSLNMEDLLKEAMRNKEYKVAIRISYLMILKNLAQNNFIHWKPEKTNREYLFELNTRSFKSEFDHIIRIFEYIWYGNFDFEEQRLLHFLNDFKEFNTKIKMKK